VLCNGIFPLHRRAYRKEHLWVFIGVLS
jgi:hypothetical protein